MAEWFRNNWPELLVVTIPAVLGLLALGWYHHSKRTSLLAAVVGFTFLAAALLGGALWAAGVPQAVFGSPNLTTANGLSQPDAIWKVTQSVTLTFGALAVVAASVITYHRQRSQEQQVQAAQDQVVAAQKQLKQDRRKYQLELDKFAQEQTKYAEDQVRETQRRQQERYAQGAQMLADQSPAVRIAGLNVIAALGREVGPEDELRQTCVNLVCAYLRASSPATPVPAKEEKQAESLPDDRYRVVAAEACRLLPTLLEEVPSSDDGYAPPPGLNLDLRQVYLIDLNLSGRHLGPVRCDGATFSGYAGFDGATFAGFAGFDGATFSGTAGFAGATFSGAARFAGATFGWWCVFDGATFAGPTWFDGATFSEGAGFDGATFLRYRGPDALLAADAAAGE